MALADTIPDTTLWAALERHIEMAGDIPVLSSAGDNWTARRLRDEAETLAGRLAVRGVGNQSLVLVALPNGVDHVVLILALVRLGAIWAAISPDQRGPALEHVVKITSPALVIAVPEVAKTLAQTGLPPASLIVYQRDTGNLADQIGALSVQIADHRTSTTDVRAIVFTSGTTGPPKGTQVTERMLVASAWGAAHASDATPGDRFLLWEPIYHIGGAQMLVLALLLPVQLFLIPRFSASRFWGQNRDYGITKLHYLGGVLEILLKQPPNTDDTSHEIALGFGAGARPDVWRSFQDRFGIPLREVYGLTEASSFATLNRNGPVGSIGKPLPWTDIAVLDEKGREVGEGQVGEIVIQPTARDLLTPGYLNAPTATGELLGDGGLHTGDLGRRDTQGWLFFVGRRKEAIRRRGELVSAWEVETALIAHPDVAECAAIAVPADIGEEEILAFIRPVDGVGIDLTALARWADATLPRRSSPRYWRLVDDFPRTPSARIAKAELPRDVGDAFDTMKG